MTTRVSLDDLLATRDDGVRRTTHAVLDAIALEDPWGVQRDSRTSSNRVRCSGLAPGQTPDDVVLASFLEQSILLKEVRR
ncbi:hypothetical protein ACFFGH_28675 [Lysobacter korlensis]|uniref:Uncharacterized protein n=1 Tax=Lysobacter korlensis TaxID=553636 RepID=A0ABV6RYG4_9GAMM